jgi:hypothetical protein
MVGAGMTGLVVPSTVAIYTPQHCHLAGVLTGVVKRPHSSDATPEHENLTEARLREKIKARTASQLQKCIYKCLG